MSKRSRYLLIVLGVIVFLVLAPTIALYSAGLSYDWQNGRLVKTGILAFKVEPKNPEAKLDNKAVGNDGTLRFLQPKDYLLSFTASGYCSWKKKLPVNAGEVTWANPYNGKIFLLKNQTAPQTITTGALDFYYTKNLLYVLTANQLEIFRGNVKQSSINLSAPAQSFTAINQDGKFLIRGSNTLLVADSQSQSLYDISKIFSGSVKILTGSGNNLLALDKGALYQTTDQGANKTLLTARVADFAVLGSDVYVLQDSVATSSLLAFSLQNPGATTSLADLPRFITAEIFVTAQKQIFILGDGQLYQVGLQLKNLGSISQVGFDSPQQALIYFGQGEADFFDFDSGQPRLISRSGQSLTNLHLSQNLGYAFWQKNNQIEALELDSRDAQNSCLLYQGQDLKKFQPDEDNKIIFILDAGEIKTIEIR